MKYFNDSHKSRFEEALELSGAVGGKGVVKSDFGASLYILSGLEYVYPRVRKFITSGCIDFEPMLNRLGLSSGEKIVVALAGNLYNGGFFDDYTLADIFECTDEETFELVLYSLELRKKGIDVASIAS
ncbi:MAG: hypothetical protein RR162_00385 [Oscillospiraceae bacterium]